MKFEIQQDHLKQIAVSFFYWWHNQEGRNTSEGFDQFMQLPSTGALLDQFKIKVTTETNEVGFSDLPKPMSKIIEESGIPFKMLPDGAYYHHKDVCGLLRTFENERTAN